MTNFSKRVMAACVLIPLAVWVLWAPWVIQICVLMGLGAGCFYELFFMARRKKKLGFVKWVSFGYVFCGVVSLLFIVTVCPSWEVLKLLVVVWTTDTMAYFVGRYVGGPKLAPQVSPQKTWSGFVGGIFFAIVSAGFLTWVEGGPFSQGLLGQSFLLAVSAQGGDLVESWMKRSFQVKDSGVLIPGHGGLLDRVDGLLMAGVVYSLVFVLSW